ncbi:hypothetical protein KA078_02085 [Candidatus Woesebacteria bacterium]|nr:hypothetical protein [Candidatus Woesebacteria bacterium]
MSTKKLDNLVTYIQGNASMPLAQIEVECMKTGYTKAEIVEALKLAVFKQEKTATSISAPKSKNVFIVVCFLCICAAILAGAVLTYFGSTHKQPILPASQLDATPTSAIEATTPREQTQPMNTEVFDTSNTHFNYNEADLSEKRALILSNEIDDVTNAIRMGHIPDGKSDDRSFSTITLKAFKFNLDSNTYQKMANFINIVNFKNTESVTINQAAWEGYSHSEASGMYTKNGYACIIMEPNRFGASPYISCANVINLSMNTISDVSSFMIKNLSSAGINCETVKCSILETREEFPLNKYGRDLVYFDKNIVNNNEDTLISNSSYEASQSAKFLESSGWSVTLQDYTDKENSWNKQTVFSILITAENHYLQCSHAITIMDKDKRQMIKCTYKNEVLEEVQNFYNPYK